MTDAPTPNGIVTTKQIEEPQKALCQFVAEVRADLEVGHTRLSSSETVEQLITAATHTHKTLVDHGQTLGEYVQMVQNWRQQAGA